MLNRLLLGFVGKLSTEKVTPLFCVNIVMVLFACESLNTMCFTPKSVWNADVKNHRSLLLFTGRLTSEMVHFELWKNITKGFSFPHHRDKRFICRIMEFCLCKLWSTIMLDVGFSDSFLCNFATRPVCSKACSSTAPHCASKGLDVLSTVREHV